MFPVAAATAAGWLLLFFVLLVLPSASQPRRDERAAPGMALDAGTLARVTGRGTAARSE